MGANVDDLRIASGAPDGFTDDSLLLIEQLRSLEAGEFSLTANSLEFASDAQDFDVYDSVSANLAQIDRAEREINFDLPTIEPFFFAVKKKKMVR